MWEFTDFVCARDCQGRANSLGTGNEGGTCDCTSGFIWNYQQDECTKDCSGSSLGPVAHQINDNKQD